MRVKRRRKIKKGRVLLVIICLMIIMGGIVMLYNHKLKDSDSENNSLAEDKVNEIKEDNENTDTADELINEATSNLEKAPSYNEEFKNLVDGEYLTDTGYTLMIKNGIAYVEGHLIVNKTYNVPVSYIPINSENAITGEKCNNCLDKEVMASYKQMENDATSIGLNIYIASGYRSYSYQERLYNNYTAVSGVAGADTYSARAGHSEHQTGLCFDLNSVDDSFANTDEGRWINDNAWFYGFIIRYPKGKESITGYQYESWHLRYVGKELAEKLYNKGNWITMEEYYGLSSNY